MSSPGPGSVRVDYADGEPNGLAAMIGGLIEGNVAADAGRARLLRPAVVGIIADDAHVAMTMRMAPGRVTVSNGIVGDPQVLVRTDSETLTELTAAPLRFGFPDATKRDGRALTAKLLRGTLAVRGLLRHPRIVARLNRLLSVA
jgi:hypothetical protein